MAQEILKIENVRKEFDSTVAVAEASFIVHKGEIFGLVGPNGAGKTTLIRMILDILKPDSGEIHFSLSDSDNDSLHKDKVGYLPEERGLYEDRRVKDILLYFAQLKNIKAERALERILFWLNKLDLQEHLASRIRQLSKGMQQKIQFIASILHEPELVILDEPFAGLDPVNQDLFQEIIRELREGGMTVLLSSHQMNLVENICDRIFLINKGRQVLYGGLREIKRGWGEDLVHLEFRGDGNFLTRCSELKHVNVHTSAPAHDSFIAELILPQGVSPNDFIELISDKLEILELKITKPPLHDIFVALVKESNKSTQKGEKDC